MNQKKRIALLPLLGVVLALPVWAQQGTGDVAYVPPTQQSVEEMARKAAFRSWKISLVSLVGGQTLDAASSYGMRELNPLLASTNGGFEAKGMAIKLGVTGAVVGVEYFFLRKYPRSAPIISKLNWTTGIVTTGFAIHNFAIK